VKVERLGFGFDTAVEHLRVVHVVRAAGAEHDAEDGQSEQDGGTGQAAAPGAQYKRDCSHSIR
jgi:hypothetical protein